MGWFTTCKNILVDLSQPVWTSKWPAFAGLGVKLVVMVADDLLFPAYCCCCSCGWACVCSCC
jgi:hypothetical protein